MFRDECQIIFLQRNRFPGLSIFWFKFYCIRRKRFGNDCMSGLSNLSNWNIGKATQSKAWVTFQKRRNNLVDGRLENWVSEGKTFQFELEERTETDYNWCCCAFVAEKNGFQEDWIQSRSDRASKPDRWKAETENVRLNKSVIVRNRANADLAKNLINAHFSGKDAQERVLLCETVLVHFAAGWRRPGFLCADGKRVIELNTQGKEVNLAIPSDMPEDVRMEMGIGLHILESRQSQTDLNWGGQNQCKLYLDSKKDQELGAYPNRKADRIFRINEGRNVSRPVRPCL